MFRKILFATDLGPLTSLSLAYVESLAQHFDAQISLVHAVPPLSEFTNAVVKSYCSDDIKREVLKAGNVQGIIESVKDEVFEMIASQSEVEENILNRLKDIVIVPGKPVPIILFEADRLEADIIVIGSYGVDGAQRNVLGSVATKILQLSRVPVLLVPMINPNPMDIRNV
ncbi:universal stress protein [Agarilytica rhodophyticola]|uniref:universal stress protein n=1 Tax=Agarilytica rhodophyticola TaxID=1737490 RepID=UPI000B340EFE|nr:universal stress protein [Agarilytica rhodophyticola]